jgi:hypothetical protein
MLYNFFVSFRFLIHARLVLSNYRRNSTTATMKYDGSSSVSPYTKRLPVNQYTPIVADTATLQLNETASPAEGRRTVRTIAIAFDDCLVFSFIITNSRTRCANVKAGLRIPQ